MIKTKELPQKHEAHQRALPPQVKTAPFGSWKSPLSSKVVCESAVEFKEVKVDPKTPGIVYWTECRFDEDGRYVICSQKTGGAPQSLTPNDYNARSLVYESDCSNFFVNDRNIYFSNYKDQRIYVQSSDKPIPITPEGKGFRYAEGEINNKTGKLYCIREDHSVVERKEAKYPTHTIVVINPETQEQNVLVQGCDFYSHPRVSPDGKKIAWIQWNQPNKLIISTELWAASLTESGESLIEGSKKMISGGNGESIAQPGWRTDGGLLYVSDKSDWWNLYQVTSDGKHVNMLPIEKEMNIGNPAFAVGNDKIALIIGGKLGILNTRNGKYENLETGFTLHSFVNLAVTGEVYCLGASPTRLPCLLKIKTDTEEIEVLKESKHLSIEDGYLSIPEEISWQTTVNGTSYGFFYPPCNKDFQGIEGEKPPLLVTVHGGPTSKTTNTLDLRKQYFTSRGFAVLDVNYRGSTGYGKEYRSALYGRWGIYDRDDCCSGAQHLVTSGKVDPDKLCIAGRSAGGYATLTCLTFTDTFKAGASHSGICDLGAIANDTDKLRSGYLDWLVCPYSCGGIQIYKDRSPFNFVDQLKCPVAFFHGDEDKAVPPNQAEMMYNSLKEKGLPTMFFLFKGEQHGVRKRKNIETSLDGEFYFFSKVFEFEPADIDFRFQQETSNFSCAM